MKKPRKSPLLLALALLVATLLAACTSGDGAPAVAEDGGQPEQQAAATDGSKPTIRFAHMYTDGEFGEYFGNKLDEFVAENSDIANWVIESEQGDNLRNKIKIDMAADNLPDVFTYWALSSLTAMIDADLLLNVKEYVDLSETMSWDSFPDNMWVEFTPDGGQNYYGIPTTASLDYFLYNKEIFAEYGLEPPETYEDLLAVSEVLVENGIIPLAVGSKGGNPAHFYYAQMYYQYGTLEYMQGVATGETSFICEENRIAGQLITEQVQAGVFPSDPIGSGDFLPAVSLYNEGKAAMIAGQTWSIGNFSDEISLKSGVIDFPRLPGEIINDPADFTVGGVNNSFVISKAGFEDPAKQAAIVKLMDFITGEDIYQYWTTTGSMGTRVMDYDYSESPILFELINDHVASKQGFTNFWILMPDPNSQEVLSTAMDELWVQAIDGEQVMEKTQKAIDDYLAQNG